MERFPNSFGFIEYIPQKAFGKGRKKLARFLGLTVCGQLLCLATLNKPITKAS